MNSIENLEWRYATKKFDPSKILTSNQLTTLKKAFNLTPTSFGLQPIKLVVVSNKKLRDEILPNAFYQKQVIEASHLLVICIQSNFSDEDIHNYFDLEKEIRGTDDEIISKYRNQLLSMFEKKSITDKENSFKQQAYLALGNLLTVCANEKIDSCPMEGFIPQKVDEILNLKSLNLKSVLLLPVGFRADDDFMKELKKVRKPITDTVIEIK